MYLCKLFSIDSKKPRLSDVKSDLKRPPRSGTGLYFEFFFHKNNSNNNNNNNSRHWPALALQIKIPGEFEGIEKNFISPFLCMPT